MPRALSAVVALSVSLIGACGSARVREAPGPRRVGPLPPLPALSAPPAQLETALDRAGALLAETPPAPPPATTLEETAGWLVEVYLPWTSAWLERIAEVADPLAAASALDPDLRVFASSIVALLFETARSRVLAFEVPADVAADDASSAEWAALLAEATAPAAAEARELLAACVELAARRTDAGAWRDDCVGRLAALPAP